MPEHVRLKLIECNKNRKPSKKAIETARQLRINQEMIKDVVIGDKVVSKMVASAIQKTMKPVKQICLLTGKVTKIWNSISEAARAFDGKEKLNFSAIQSVCVQRDGSKKWRNHGWVFAKNMNDFEPIDLEFFKPRPKGPKPKPKSC